MRFLRKNTAVIVTVGPFYDKTDGVTIKTALTITNEKITLTADTDDGSAPTNILDNITGATSGTANDLNYITGNDAGMMQMELAAADTNRLGRMFLSITDAANHAPVFHEFMVVNATLYDAFFATSGGAIPNVAAGASNGLPLAVDASGRVDVLKINGTSQTARDLGASVLLSSGTGTGQLDFTSGVVKANATQWLGGTIPAVNVTGVPLVDAKYLLGTVFPTPTVAGVPNVNVKTWNDLTTVALPLVPTTAGRTLDVSSTGEAGVDWANVGSPTTTNDLSGTTIKTSQVVASVTGAVGSVTGAVGSVTGAVGSVTGLTASDVGAIKTQTDKFVFGETNKVNISWLGDAAATLALKKLNIVNSAGDAIVASSTGSNGNGINASGNGSGNGIYAAGGDTGHGIYGYGGASAGYGMRLTGPESGSGQGLTVDGSANMFIIGSMTGNISGNVTGSVGSVTGAVGSVTGNVGGNVVGTVQQVLSLATAASAAIADKLLGRNLLGGADGTRTVQDALRALRNKTSLAAGVLTVYKEDDTTVAWTAVVAQAARDPITSIDPA